MYLEAKPELVFMFAWHFPLKELLQEDPGNLDGTLQFKARLVKQINVSLLVVTWLTVVPMLPCSSICRIFGSFDLMAESSFAT